MTTHTPFIINLARHPQGYTFHSLQDTSNTASKTKKPKPPQPKNPLSKITNRLIKEIGLSGQIPPIIPQQNPYSKQINNQPEDFPKNQIQYVQEEEEIDCEVKRNCELPNTPALWFSLKDIHQIQIQHFPQYFTGKGYKTPELYQAYRNFVVEAYQKNKKRYLTFIACRRVLKGDVNSILKIFRFLMNEGIVNYGLGPDGNYNFRQLALGKALQIEKKPQSFLKKLPQHSQCQKERELDTDNLTVTVINKNFSRTYRVYCYQCKLICGVVWYASAGDDQKSKSLCVDCFNELDREQASGFVRTDITKRMESNKEGRAQGKTNWALDDNIKLLDFIGSSEDGGWDDIINQFQGKKTIQDIVIQFMQFPITNFDPYAEESKHKHNRIEYKHQQHIKMLQDLYMGSSYAAKQEVKHQQQDHSPAVPLTKLKQLTSLILSKYTNKLDQLHSLQTIYEETNLDIAEQIQVNRVRNSRAEDVLVQGMNEWERESENNQFE